MPFASVLVLVLAAITSAGVGTYYLRAQPMPEPREPPEKPLPKPWEFTGKLPEGYERVSKDWDKPLKRPDVASPNKKAVGKPEEHFQKLLQARREMAEQEFFVRYELYRAGANEPGSGNPTTLYMVIDASKHLLKAELELSKKKSERVKAHEKHLNFMKEIANITEAQHKVGRVSRAAFASALYEQLDAEIELEHEKAR